MAYKIAFYDTKPYDERSFTEANEKFGFDIKFYKGHLNMNNVVLTKGADVVCIFVNDTADAEVIRAMADNGVKLLALRCARFDCYGRPYESGACSGLFTLCRCRVYGGIDAFAQSQDTSCNDAHPRWKLFIAWVDGI